MNPFTRPKSIVDPKWITFGIKKNLALDASVKKLGNGIQCDHKDIDEDKAKQSDFTGKSNSVIQDWTKRCLHSNL